MNEIARARDRTWTRNGEVKPKRALQSKRPSLRRALKDLSGRQKCRPSSSRSSPHSSSEPPDGAKWIHEIKFDGYRIVARIDSGEVRLFSRNEKDWTSRFPEIADAIAEIPVGKAILDGEVVALAPNGASSFGLLQEALSSQRTAKLIYQVFDLLHLEGYDLTGVAQVERKRAPEGLVGQRIDSIRDARVRYTDHIEGKGPQFFRQSARSAWRASSRRSPTRRIVRDAGAVG